MSHLSTLMLHQYRLDELDPVASQAAEQHLASCDACTQRLDAARAEATAFSGEPLPAFLEGLAARPSTATGPLWALWLRKRAPSFVALVAAAAVLVMGLPTMQRPADDGIRTRGSLPSVEVWIESEAGPRPLRVGEALREGDQVQLFFDPKTAQTVALAGRDDSGEIEVYRVLTPTRPGLQPAPFGLTLDDARGTQEFFVVAGGRSMDDAAVRKAIRTGEGDVQRIVIPKDPQP